MILEAARQMETHNGSSPRAKSIVLLSAIVTFSGLHPVVYMTAADLRSGDGRG